VKFECSQHLWRKVQFAGGGGYDCNFFAPPNTPKDGDACNCFGKLDCTYDDCGGRGQIHAWCDNTTWHVKETACARQTCGADGSISCGPGDVCVFHDNFMPTYSCVPNPCGTMTTSCDCAASICGSPGLCSMIDGSVACICPAC